MASWNPSQCSSLTLRNSFHTSADSKSLNFSRALSKVYKVSERELSLLSSCNCGDTSHQSISEVSAPFSPTLSFVLDTISKSLLWTSGGLGSHIPFADKKGGLRQHLQSQASDSVFVSFMHVIATTNDTAYLLCTRHCTEHLLYMNSFHPHNRPVR